MNMMEMMKQAQSLQKKIEEAQNRANEIEAEGKSGGGLVSVLINGDKEVKKVSIDKSLISADEAEVLEDLLVAAFNDAKTKVEDAVAKEMQAVAAGLPLPPGMKLPF